MIKAQRGTKDILPDEITTWQEIYKRANELFTNANCKEIRTPILKQQSFLKEALAIQQTL